MRTTLTMATRLNALVRRAWPVEGRDVTVGAGDAASPEAPSDVGITLNPLEFATLVVTFE